MENKKKKNQKINNFWILVLFSLFFLLLIVIFFRPFIDSLFSLKKSINSLSLEKIQQLSIIFYCLFWSIIFIIFSFFLFFFIFNKNDMSSFFLEEKNNLSDKKSDLNFSKIGGLHNVKEELLDIINFFKNPKLFIDKGVKKNTKGIILYGEPGTGKTMIGKAIANECQVSFIYKSASEFESIYVGLGALKIRELFSKARKKKNGCIIFIDEFDLICSKRRERESHANQTFYQLINEMDVNDMVLVIGATNRIDFLDESVRAGRFDRIINIPKPDFHDRKEIIKINILNKPFKNIDIENISLLMRGFSGAEIENVINQSLIMSIREKKEFVDSNLLLEAIDRILIGGIKNKESSFKSKEICAYHESGHTIIALVLPETTVKKVTIQSRSNVGGYTWVWLIGDDEDDNINLINKKQLMSKIMTSLGGKISEELIFGSDGVTTGSQSDLEQVNNIANDIIFKYGMSNIGIVSESENNRLKIWNKEYENEKKRIITECEKKVREILKRKIYTLKLLSRILLEKKVILKSDIIYIFANNISPYVYLLK